FGHWLDLHGVPPSACCQPLMLFVVFPPDQCITPEPLLRWAYLWVIVRASARPPHPPPPIPLPLPFLFVIICAAAFLHRQGSLMVSVSVPLCHILGRSIQTGLTMLGRRRRGKGRWTGLGGGLALALEWDDVMRLRRTR
ncbi:MAG TPA: hypothetical protein VFB60_28455, partial [Ktedonobacteraceae bacterium]|nr:hypothetical protein [Ktedonobacteraceae bacterium]